MTIGDLDPCTFGGYDTILCVSIIFFVDRICPSALVSHTHVK